MTNPDQYSLFDDLDAEAKSAGAHKEELLPVCDGGYFDALVAIGFAAVVHSYVDIDEDDSPLIEWTPNGFKVSYSEKPERTVPDLEWLRYSVAADWRKGVSDEWDAPPGFTLVNLTSEESKLWDEKIKVWNKTKHGIKPVKPKFARVATENAEVDVSKEIRLTLLIGEKSTTIVEPMRQLYGVVNKLSSPKWFNLCIYICREKGMKLIDGSFKDDGISLNSMILPQSSKGASGSNSFSISNNSLADNISTSLSRYTCLAIAGFIIASTGQMPKKQVQGFAIPLPKNLRLQAVKRLATDNRQRRPNGGFFFVYDNYLSFIKQLLVYNEERGLSNEESSLFAIAGANFIPLGENAVSPSGSWQLVIPKHRYSIGSVDRLQRLLVTWKRTKESGENKVPSIDRASVAELMRGFEYSDPAEIASGYLAYVFDVGLVTKKGNFYPLTQNLFEEIMEYKYQSLLQELQENGDLRPFIDLVRRETYTVATTPGQAKKQPNYQMIRSLREVQNKEDFIIAVTEIAIERGVTKVATAQSRDSKAKYWTYAYETSLIKLIELADSEYPPKLLANLILAFALSKRPQAEGEEEAVEELEDLITDENDD